MYMLDALFESKNIGLLNDLKFEVGPQITTPDPKNMAIHKW